MNLDGFALTLLVKELQSVCEQETISKIVQIDKHTLMLKLGKSNHNLVIAMGNMPACYISDTLADLAQEPTSLCMFLRKHYENGRILSINQVNGDRIIKITVGKLSLGGTLESKEIYVELMGKYSNCIFVQDGTILEALVHVTGNMSQERVIMPKVAYVLPPNSQRLNLLEFSEKEIYELLLQYKQSDIQTTLRNVFNGFGPQVIDEVMCLSQMDKKQNVDSLTDEDWRTLSAVLFAFAEKVNSSNELYAYSGNSAKKRIYSPIRYAHIKENPVPVENIFSLFEKDLLQSKGIQTTTTRLIGIVQNALLKEKKRYQKIVTELAETDKVAKCKLYADLLMINAYRKISYAHYVDVENIFEEGSPVLRIPLQANLDIVENANGYYKKYTKLKNRRTYGEEQRLGSVTKIAYLESVLYSLESADDIKLISDIKHELEDAGLIKKEKKHLKQTMGKDNLLTIPIDGGRIIIGRNNKQNDFLTHRQAKETDTWFHALKIPGSHVILQTDHTPTEEEIMLAASYAAAYSQSKNDNRVPVDYTLVKFVKKPSGAAPGFVTYTKQKTLFVEPHK